MILKYTKIHKPAVIDIYYQASLVAHPFLDREFIVKTKIDVRDIYLAAVETWVFSQDEGIVGFISLMGNEVVALFVEPASHGQGFGKQLMDKAVSEKGDLVVDVFEKNAIGRKFYSRYGFTFKSKYLHEPSQQTCLQLMFQASNRK